MTRNVCGMVAGAFAVLMTLALTFISGHPSFAQQAKKCAPTEIDPGGKGIINGYNGKGFVAIKACASGEVLIGHGKALPAMRRLFAEVAEMEYVDSFEVRFCDLPQGSDVPGAPISVRFASGNKAANASRTLSLAPDTEKPTLTTTSDPKKGSRVAPKQKIVVRMHADEGYGQPRSGWQGGVKKIQLRDESLNQDVRPHFEAPGGAAPCDRKLWEQTLEVTYEVPDNPPPVIRLRACAWDHANNQDCDVAEFPTGQWQGRLEWSMRVQAQGGSWTRFYGDADLAVNHDGQGKLSGSIQGNVSMEGEDRDPGLCPVVKTIRPTVGRARLVGSLAPEGNVMSIRTEQVESVSQGQLTPCPTATLPAPTADFAVMLHTDTLRQRPDESFYASGATASGSQFFLTLRPAQQ